MTDPDFTKENFDKMQKKIFVLRKVVEAQAKDEGLWFMAQHAPEAYLQRELRYLHAIIECD